MMNRKKTIHLILGLSALLFILIGGFLGITVVKKASLRHNTLVFFFSPALLPEEKEGFLGQMEEFRKDHPSLQIDVTATCEDADFIIITHKEWSHDDYRSQQLPPEGLPLVSFSPEDFPRAVTEAFSIRGQTPVLPLLGSPLGLYYNKALLKQTGYPLPEKWESFSSLLGRLDPEASLPLLLPPGTEAVNNPAYQYLAANRAQSLQPEEWDLFKEEWDQLILQEKIFTPSMKQPLKVTLQSLLHNKALFLLAPTTARRRLEITEQNRLGLAPIPTLTGRPAYLPARLTGLLPSKSGLTKKHGPSLLPYFLNPRVQEELASRSSLQGYTYLYALHREARYPHTEARTVSLLFNTAAGIIPAE